MTTYEMPKPYPYTSAGLTPENGLTPKNIDIQDNTALTHDITIMNPEQLHRYITDAFLQNS